MPAARSPPGPDWADAGVAAAFCSGTFWRSRHDHVGAEVVVHEGEETEFDPFAVNPPLGIHRVEVPHTWVVTVHFAVAEKELPRDKGQAFGG